VTFLERLQAHKGGLIRLKTQLYWYDGRGNDGSPGRVCLLLDARALPALAAYAATASAGDVQTAILTTNAATAALDALLLVDGSPQWVWVVDGDVEVIDEAG